MSYEFKIETFCSNKVFFVRRNTNKPKNKEIIMDIFPNELQSGIPLLYNIPRQDKIYVYIGRRQTALHKFTFTSVSLMFST